MLTAPNNIGLDWFFYTDIDIFSLNSFFLRVRFINKYDNKSLTINTYLALKRNF